MPSLQEQQAAMLAQLDAERVQRKQGLQNLAQDPTIAKMSAGYPKNPQQSAPSIDPSQPEAQAPVMQLPTEGAQMPGLWGAIKNISEGKNIYGESADQPRGRIPGVKNYFPAKK